MNGETVGKMARCSAAFKGNTAEKVRASYQRGANLMQAMTGKRPQIPRGADAQAAGTALPSGGYIDHVLESKARGEKILSRLANKKRANESKPIAGKSSPFPPARSLKANAGGPPKPTPESAPERDAAIARGRELARRPSPFEKLTLAADEVLGVNETWSIGPFMAFAR